jgi:uncharacterized protein (TIGR00730 family)
LPANITVFASSSQALAPIYYSDAENLGEKLAVAGHTVVYGGGNNGLMGALARSVKTRGGRLIGVIPRMFRTKGFCFEQADEIIETDTLGERKAILCAKSDAFIVLPGGLGTLDELFDVLAQKQLKYHDKPVILLNIDSFFSPLLEYMAKLTKNNFISGRPLHELANDVGEVMRLLDRHLANKKS